MLAHFSIFALTCKKWCTCVNHALKIDISYDDGDTFSTLCTSCGLIVVSLNLLV